MEEYPNYQIANGTIEVTEPLNFHDASFLAKFISENRPDESITRCKIPFTRIELLKTVKDYRRFIIKTYKRLLDFLQTVKKCTAKNNGGEALKFHIKVYEAMINYDFNRVIMEGRKGRNSSRRNMDENEASSSGEVVVNASRRMSSRSRNTENVLDKSCGNRGQKKVAPKNKPSTKQSKKKNGDNTGKDSMKSGRPSQPHLSKSANNTKNLSSSPRPHLSKCGNKIAPLRRSFRLLSQPASITTNLSSSPPPNLTKSGNKIAPLRRSSRRSSTPASYSPPPNLNKTAPATLRRSSRLSTSRSDLSSLSSSPPPNLTKSRNKIAPTRRSSRRSSTPASYSPRPNLNKSRNKTAPATLRRSSRLSTSRSDLMNLSSSPPPNLTKSRNKTASATLRRSSRLSTSMSDLMNLSSSPPPNLTKSRNKTAPLTLRRSSCSSTSKSDLSNSSSPKLTKKELKNMNLKQTSRFLSNSEDDTVSYSSSPPPNLKKSRSKKVTSTPRASYASNGKCDAKKLSSSTGPHLSNLRNDSVNLRRSTRPHLVVPRNWIDKNFIKEEMDRLRDRIHQKKRKFKNIKSNQSLPAMSIEKSFEDGAPPQKKRRTLYNSESWLQSLSLNLDESLDY